MKKMHKASLSMAAAVLLGSQMTTTAAQEEFSANVDSEGNISLPDDFRINMVHLGSWFVPEGGASGFHPFNSKDTPSFRAGRNWNAVYTASSF